MFHWYEKNKRKQKEEERLRERKRRRETKKKYSLNKESMSTSTRSKFPCNCFFSFSSTIFSFHCEHVRLTGIDDASGSDWWDERKPKKEETEEERRRRIRKERVELANCWIEKWSLFHFRYWSPVCEVTKTYAHNWLRRIIARKQLSTNSMHYLSQFLRVHVVLFFYFFHVFSSSIFIRSRPSIVVTREVDKCVTREG